MPIRLLINLTDIEKKNVPALKAILAQHGLTGLISTQVYDIPKLQKTARDAGCDAILCINEATLVAITGRNKATLDAYRGSRFNYPIPIFVCNPLSHIWGVSYGRWLFDRDLEKIQLLHRPAESFTYTKADTFESLERCRADAATAVIISNDVETLPDYQLITCIGFAMLMPDMTKKVYLLPFVDFGQPHYKGQQDLYAYAVETMRLVLASEAFKVMHNGTYDGTYEIRYNAEPHNFVLDTMILGWARFSELPRALDFNSSIYLYDHVQWKFEADEATTKKDIQSYWTYCATDAWRTLRIVLQQLGLTKPTSYWVYNYKRTFKLSYPAIYMGYEGCLIDQDKRTELDVIAKAEHTQKLADLRLIANNPQFNPGSWQQAQALIYGTLGAIKPPHVKKGAGTDAKTLNFVAMQHPLLAVVVDIKLKYMERQKEISTYYGFDLTHGRATWSIDVSGTESGRMASSKSAWATGLQIQNIPTSGVKDFFMPDPGYDLLEVDKRKSEAMCVAYLSQSISMIEALSDTKRDYYKVLTNIFFGIPYEEVTKEVRNEITKRIIHGSNYLLGAMTFIVTVSPKKLFVAMGMLGKLMPLLNFAKYLLGLYHIGFPNLKGQWYPSILKEVKLTKHLKSVLGWTRRFFFVPGSKNEHDLLRQSVAHVPQNLSVELLNDDLYLDYLIVLREHGKFRLKAQIHDSRWAQVHQSIKQRIILELQDRDVNQKPVLIHGREMRILSDFAIGENGGSWASIKD